MQWDLNNLKTAWDAIVAANDGRPAPFLIFQESDAVTRGLRDYFSDDVGECLIDQPCAFQKAQEYMRKRFMCSPDAQRKLKLYQDPVPLFTRYQDREARSSPPVSHKAYPYAPGGSLVIDHTKRRRPRSISTRPAAPAAGDIEATARNTNLEGAEELRAAIALAAYIGILIVHRFHRHGVAGQPACSEDMLRDGVVKMDRAT